MKQQSANRRKATKGSHYKVTNWKEYNQALKQRGSLELWIGNEIEEQWYYQGEKQRGAQYQYSDSCIKTACLIKEIYHLGYRQTQGFLQSLIRQLGWRIKEPDYTVLNRRRRHLNIEVKGISKEKKYLVIDSSGVKVYGEGEWKVRQHGYNKRRTWRKIHLAVDESTGAIQSCELTTNNVDDAAMVGQLLSKVAGKVSKVAADGAYDKNKVYEELHKRKIRPIIPPRKGARIAKHGNAKGKELPRDKAIRQLRKWGKKQWKKKVGYHRRSIAESAFFRLKTIFGGQLASRNIEQQQVEVRLKCYALNKMAKLGMPTTIKLNKAA